VVAAQENDGASPRAAPINALPCLLDAQCLMLPQQVHAVIAAPVDGGDTEIPMAAIARRGTPIQIDLL
jgi:hypothetical protein